MRLRELTRHVYGEERPKQYAVFTGGKSLLRQTLDRVRLLIPPERTVVVTIAGQETYLTGELRSLSAAPYVLMQPKYRGTAAAILLAAHWIRAKDPNALAVVLPSDHFVADDGIFKDRMGELIEAAREYLSRIVLLGAEPSEPETDYGWIELAERLEGSGSVPLYSAKRFAEKPDRETAEALFECGALWNTFVFGGSTQALLDLERERLPLLHERLEGLDRFLGTEHERWAIAGPTSSLRARARTSRAPCSSAAPTSWPRCGCRTSRGVTSAPCRRVVRTLDELGIRPGWLATLPEAG